MESDNMDFLYENDPEYAVETAIYNLDRLKEEEGYDINPAGVEFIAVPAWRTADGRLVAIHCMSTQHILNCLKKIEHSDNTWRHGYIPYFLNELKKRVTVNL